MSFMSRCSLWSRSLEGRIQLFAKVNDGSLFILGKPSPSSVRFMGKNHLSSLAGSPVQLRRFSISRASSFLRRSMNNGSDTRYARLNRFQQFGQDREQPNNSLRNLTLFGLGIMGATFFVTPSLFDHVPPFTYFKSHPTHLVYGILGINCVVFGLWHVPKYWRFLQRYMLLEKGSSASKWSLIGSAFSHQEVWHLGMNMLALWSFGTSLATLIGPANFFSLYLNSAIAGSLFSLWFPRIAKISMMAPSLGASGALFGLFGCFSYLIPHAKIMLFVFPIPGGAWLSFLGLMAWNMAGCVLRWGSFDYAAHLGGSVLGILYGWLISEKIKRERAKRMRTFSLF
ncbi:LAMI_0H05468g1_1 [Lachancea mirantina]|uniref:LAMI_0H05468g1_1 n=1 Tax=Lachancea mirantina TaxID=1230905 RepID=A0A1G4KEW4_9SACH|nr:LAMI_0H05468g1_1 [Lachancea mirantina]